MNAERQIRVRFHIYLSSEKNEPACARSEYRVKNGAAALHTALVHKNAFHFFPRSIRSAPHILMVCIISLPGI